MRSITTSICCICLAIAGYFITSSRTNATASVKQNTVSAATLPNWKINGQNLYEDLVLDIKKTIKPDTVVIRDTVIVNNQKRNWKRKSRSVTTPDTIPVQAQPDSVPAVVKQPNLGFDSIPDIKLIINEQVVYSSKNYQDSISDGLQKP